MGEPITSAFLGAMLYQLSYSTISLINQRVRNSRPANFPVNIILKNRNEGRLCHSKLSEASGLAPTAEDTFKGKESVLEGKTVGLPPHAFR